MKKIDRIKESFAEQSSVYWANLSRLTNLLIMLNLTFFFLTELVTKQGFYYTYYSLLALGIVVAGLILPTGFLHRIGYYCVFLFFEAVGIYFLVVSVWYWVVTNKL